jgi:hypothetical protein
MNDITVTLVGRDGCHLCDEADGIVAKVLQRFINVDYEHTSLEQNPEWEHQYGDKIPVLLLNGVEHAYWRINGERLEGALVELGAISE